MTFEIRGMPVERRQSVGISSKSASLLTIWGAVGDFNRSHYRITCVLAALGIFFRRGEEDNEAPTFPFRCPNRKRVSGRIDKDNEASFQFALGGLK